MYDFCLITFDFTSLYPNISYYDTTRAIIMSCKLLNLPNFYRDYLLTCNLNKNKTLLLLVIPPISYQGAAMDSYHSQQQHLQVTPWVLSGTILSFLYHQLQRFCHLLKTLLKTLFHTFNHYLLIAWYYIHLARNKSETLRLNVFITFFWKLKFSVKENC